MTQDIEAIARRLVVGRKRDGRSICDENAKRDLVQACRQRDVSLAKIARACGINANVLSNWLRLHEQARAPTSAPSGDVVEMAASPFAAVQLECAAQEPAATLSMQVRLPNGVVVDMQGCELLQAGRLIEALGRL